MKQRNSFGRVVLLGFALSACGMAWAAGTIDAGDPVNPQVDVDGQPAAWFVNPVAETPLVEMTPEARVALLDELTAFAIERWSATNDGLTVTPALRSHVRDTLEAALFTDRAAWERWRRGTVPTSVVRNRLANWTKTTLPAKALPETLAQQTWSPVAAEMWRRNGPVAIGTAWRASAAEGAFQLIPTGYGFRAKGTGWQPAPGPSAELFPEKRWSKERLTLLLPLAYANGITEWVEFGWLRDRSTGRWWLVTTGAYQDATVNDDRPYHFRAFGFF